MSDDPKTAELQELVARAICKADGVDPDMPCPGIGKIIPEGETWPAWRVRLRQANAALAAVLDWQRSLTSPDPAHPRQPT